MIDKTFGIVLALALLAAILALATWWAFGGRKKATATAEVRPERPREEYMVRCVSGWLWQAYRLRWGRDLNGWYYDPIVPAAETCPSREAAEHYIVYDQSGHDPALQFGPGRPPFSLFHAYYDADGNLLEEDPPASVDTRPKDEDPAQTGASLASGAVGEAETPEPHPHPTPKG